MKRIILAVIAACLLGCGNSHPSSINKVSPAEDIAGNINTVCIEGHVYYLWRPTNGLAPKLQDNGKPVKCK